MDGAGRAGLRVSVRAFQFSYKSPTESDQPKYAISPERHFPKTAVLQTALFPRENHIHQNLYMSQVARPADRPLAEPRNSDPRWAAVVKCENQPLVGIVPLLKFHWNRRAD